MKGSGRLIRPSQILAMAAALTVGSTAALAQVQNAPAGGSGGLEEVVVTAQFRSESVQNTPLAITAISGAQLAERGQTSLTDVVADSPGVMLQGTSAAFGPSMQAFIRGVGQSDLEPALEPGVGIYIDDVYFGTLTGSLLDLMDLDRVEVLRGPQGTLEGMNSEGGAIKLFTKKPDSKEEMSFDLLYGSRNHVEFRGSTNFAITDNLFVRLSGVGNHQDGYVNVLDFGCANPTFSAQPYTGLVSGAPTYGPVGTYTIGSGPTLKTNSCVIGQEGGIGYAGGRVAVRWLPTDNLEVNLVADFSNTNQENPAETLLYAGPGPLESGAASPPGGPSALEAALITIPAVNTATGAIAQIPYDQTKVPAIIPTNIYTTFANYCQPATVAHVNGAAYNEQAICGNPRQLINSWGTSLAVDWTLNPDMALRSLTSIRGYSSSWSEDNDQSIWPVGLGIEGLDHHQISEELRLNGHWEKLLDYTVGAFYFRELTTYPAHEDLSYVAPGSMGFFNFLQDDPTLAHDKAAFLHLTYHITPAFEANFGSRYTSQDKTYHYIRVDPQGNTSTIPFSNSAWLVTPLNGASSYYSGSRFDWRGDLAYHFTDQAMGYVQYSTGFKGGGVDPRPFYVQQAVAFQPESLKTYEVGIKSSWFDNHLRLNVDAYYSLYGNIQLTLGNCTGVDGIVAPYGAPCALPFNSGSAHQKGIEVESVARFGGFQIDLNGSRLDFNYESLNAATGITPGMVTPFTPSWQGSAGMQYTLPVGTGSLTARVDGNGRSEIYTAAVNGPYNRVGGYTIYNAHLTWDPGKDNWQVIVQAKNFTEKRYLLNQFDLAGLGGGSVGGVRDRRWKSIWSSVTRCSGMNSPGRFGPGVCIPSTGIHALTIEPYRCLR